MPPRLVFVPPLASTTKVPLGHACSSSVSFKIYVTVYREWWNKFRNDGKRIEVWSDLPGGGRQRGEWGETAFVEQSKGTPMQSGSSTPISEEQSFSFSLLSEVEQSSKTQAVPQAYSNDRKVTLIAAFALPQTYSHYSYTFRVTGPGGRTEWLGHMGSNGVVIVGEPGNRCGFEEEGNWTALGTSARKWDRDTETGTTEKAVAIGIFKNVDMVGWAFGKNGFNQKVTTTENTEGANLFVLHPRLDTSIASRPFTDPPSSIVVSSPGETTFICSDGTLVTTADSVTIQDFYPFGLPSEVQNATAQEWETLDSPISDGDDGSFVLIKSSPPEGGNSLVPSSVPASVAILPAVSGDTLPPTSLIQLPLPMVFQLQPQVHRSILYAPENDSVEVVDFSSPDLQAKENLSLRVGRDGGELVVVPAFEIGKAIEEADKEAEDIWTVGILEPAVTSISIEAGGQLGNVEPITPTMEEQINSIPPSEADVDADADAEAESEAEAEAESGEVVALASPVREFVPLAPESTTATEDEITMSEVKEGPSSPSEPASPAAYPPTTSIVKMNENLVGAPQHMWLGALKLALTWVHVLVGLWAVVLLRLGGAGKREVEPIKSETVELEAPTTDVADADEKPSEKPETISLDEVLAPSPVLEPTEKTEEVEAEAEAEAEAETKAEAEAEAEAEDEDEDEEEFKYPTEQPKFFPSASKSILTPPMTPPHLTANLQVSPLSAVEIAARSSSPTDAFVEELNIRTKLVFQLPPNSSGKFKLVLHHHDDQSEDGLDRLRVTVDRKVVGLDGDSEGEIEAQVRRVAAHSWLVDVDASQVQTRGKVEVSVA